MHTSAKQKHIQVRTTRLYISVTLSTNRRGLDSILFRRFCTNTDKVGIKPQHLSTCAIRAGQSWKVPPAREKRLHVPFIPNLDRRPYLLIITKRTTKRTQANAASPTAMET